MLGSDPCIDYSQKNRSLLFDINRESYSDQLLCLSGLDAQRQPAAGIDIKEFRAVGGESRNDRALQIAVDILGKPFTRSPVPEAGALGAALLAGIGAGIYRDAEDASQAVSHGKGEFFEPDTRRHHRYQEVFALYKETRDLLAPISRRWNDLLDS